jgi:hypothetical protein
MLFFIITAILFGLFSLLQFIDHFFRIYASIALYSLGLAAISLVMWMIITLLRPSTLFERGRSLHIGYHAQEFVRRIPWFRISMGSLFSGLVFSWLHQLILPISISMFLFCVEIGLAKLLFVIYGSV